MKKFTTAIVLFVLTFCLAFATACDNAQEIIDGNTKKPLSAPENVRVDEDTATLLWNSVEYANGYTVLCNKTTYETKENSFSLKVLKSGEYTISVKANGDGILYVSSPYSDTISYKRDSSSGNEYEDRVVAAFKEFDEINTKGSYLGYGIDIINASAITSKNVLMTYPIFNMDKLMNENLLKANEHYNTFEMIEGETIEEFSENMAISSSITSGAHVSAKGKFGDTSGSASASLTGSLKTNFKRTSSETEEQRFLEIIAENQSYWLILQTTEARYKEILSDEFKKDLYDKTITPAQLFGKYGTHLLTSVAMGGNICMYYTLYSYDRSVDAEAYSKVTSTLKANVKAAYGKKASGEASSSTSYSDTFTYEAEAKNHNVQVDTKIESAGGGSFGINNEQTLYDNYFDWQKSLDTQPVVIGVKDGNSLYPIWNLLDTSVNGAAERYQELYSYFQEYGRESYNELCETYKITPSVPPTDITNIKVGDKLAEKDKRIDVKPGESVKITFDVLPENANKYKKTFSVSDTSLATVDEQGVLTVLPTAKNGSYIRVNLSAGTISKQITLYIIDTFNVSFNTGFSDVTVDPIFDVMPNSFIEEPKVKKNGYILEGWYIDEDFNEKFDFEKDRINSNITLYAKWVRPVVMFDSMGGTALDKIVVVNGTIKKPKNPTKTGYTFAGWCVDEECDEEFDFTTEIAEDITLYAKWERVEFAITFVTNGGTPVEVAYSHIENGYKIQEPTTRKTYYILDGWYMDEYFTRKFDFATEVTQDTILYAKWESVKSVIKFADTDGVSPVYYENGQQIADKKTDYDNNFKITAPTNPVKTGYTFAGWYYNGELVGFDKTEFKPNADGYTMVAKWTINSYKITFVIDGEEHSSETLKYGEKIVYPPVSKVGYTFSDWTYGGKVLPEVMPAEDLTITGSYIVNNYKITYKVDGEEYKTFTVTYGESVELLQDLPAKDGKVFRGWYSVFGVVGGSATKLENFPTVMPAYDVIVDGGYEQVKFNIYYHIGDEVVYTQGVNKNETIALYVPEAKTGYSFGDWKIKDGENLVKVPSIMPANDIDLYGEYVINSYTLTFDTDGGNGIEAITGNYGTEIVKPADPIKEGYTFVKWNKEIPATMPAENVVFVAVWEINKYTLTFDTDGGNDTEEITADYGTEIVKPADPTKEGYKFVKWNVEIPATMPAENMIFVAVWKINKYTITFDTDGGNDIEEITADYGTEIVKPENPTKEGYTFSGWNKEIPATMPAEDVTFTARWTLNVSRINYEVNANVTEEGKAMKATCAVDDKGVNELNYNVTAINVAKATESYSGAYNFIGWFLSAEGGAQLTDKNGRLLDSVDGYTNANGKWIFAKSASVTLYAHWDCNSFDITFANGAKNSLQNLPLETGIQEDVVGTVLYDHDSIVGVPTLNDRFIGCKYFEIEGWYNNAGTKIAEPDGTLLVSWAFTANVTLYAIWKNNRDAIYLANTKTELSYTLSEILSIPNYQTKNFVLLEDIDMTGISWTPLTNYKGTFDGDGHKISNISITDGGTEIGFFAACNSGSVVKNLTVENAKVDVRSVQTEFWVGIIAGKNAGTITNCKIIGNSSVKGTTTKQVGTNTRLKVSVGGIAGGNGGKISECSIDGLTVYGYSNIKKSDGMVEANCGAVAGMNYGGEISKCTVTSSSVSAGVRGGKTWTATRYRTYARTGAMCGYNSATVSSCKEENNQFKVWYDTTEGSYPDNYNKKGAIVGCNAGTVKGNTYSSLTNEVG